MLSFYPPATPTPEEIALEASPAALAFRAECERKGWRTWRFARAVLDRSGESPRGLLFHDPPTGEGDWWLLCSDCDGGGGENVPEAVWRDAGLTH